ncbi:MAG: response regulator transcription factor [Bacillota bacterium]|nr:response regulator transcription factor [Bacillota bacterium]MDW7683376.1 response regulator transcription factor [Bacillota bacterium]
MIRVLIVDDHAVVRMGLKTLLELFDNFIVVGEAESGPEALSLVENERPDVVIMDIRMPGMSGIEACQEIRSRFPESKVIMLTSYADDEAVYASIMAGAAGYILKQMDNDKLVESIEKVAGGESLLDPSIAGKVLLRMKDIALEKENEAKLTETERKILLLIAEGKTNQEIADTIFLAEKTVRNYVSKIFAKLNLANRAAAAAYVAERKSAFSKKE